MAGEGDEGRERDARVPVGRRVFLSLGALATLGVVLGARLQSAARGVLGSGLGGLFPFGDRFRLYSITGSYPAITPAAYRLEVSGLVERPQTLTLADLEAMPATRLVRTFQCVTGWSVPGVAWEGVALSAILARAGVRPGAAAVSFSSYDRADTESLTLDQARMSDVIVAYRMLGAPVTQEHGGPVRLYVAPMFGYKSLKWLSAIRVVERVEPGFWERNGYPVNGWLDGSTGPTDPRLGLA
ncbi:MAG: molybdopterin-dependent oxidoreductase [Acidimicrobiales bacterium]